MKKQDFKKLALKGLTVGLLVASQSPLGAQQISNQILAAGCSGKHGCRSIAAAEDTNAANDSDTMMQNSQNTQKQASNRNQWQTQQDTQNPQARQNSQWQNQQDYQNSQQQQRNASSGGCQASRPANAPNYSSQNTQNRAPAGYTIPGCQAKSNPNSQTSAACGAKARPSNPNDDQNQWR